MTAVTTLLFALLLVLQPATALADIHKCVDGEGLVTFTDSPSRKFKTCTLLYRDPGPPPKAPTGTTPSAPSTAPAAGARPKGEAAAVRGNPGPENFPRVERGEQRDRDLKARQIVERELTNEQRALEDARRQIAALNGAPGADKADPRLREWQSAASRHERNIAEIQRQLALMK
jgi:hypothetical protein